jgi:hypothetical protein
MAFVHGKSVTYTPSRPSGGSLDVGSDREAESLGWAAFFTFLAGARAAHAFKPSPGCLNSAAAAGGVIPSLRR